VVGDWVDNDCNGVADGQVQTQRVYKWDGNGNLLSDGTTTYTWDARDRLVSNGYGYDTGNLRVKMGAQKVLLDGIEETREYGTNEARYDHDPSRVDGLLAQKTGAGKGYFVTDALGSVYAVVDSTGAEVSKYGYDVYGARSASAEGMATGWGFTGRRHDNSSLLYNRDRYREPTGFLAKDSRLLVAANHGYSYANGNPISLADPSGRYVVLQDGETSTAVFGGYQTRQGVGALEDYDFSVGLFATPTGQKVYNDVESSLIRTTVGWLGSQSELIGELGGAAGFLGEELQRIFNDAASATGSTYMELDPCSGPSPLRAFRVYWFPNSIAQFNRNFFYQGWFQSPADVVAHELAHVRPGLWLASAFPPMSYDDWVTFLRIASNEEACSVSAAVHAELYGDGFTSRSQVPCSHSR
jgi:RHS repeat-associated protein